VNITLEETKNNDGLTLVLALNYGSRAEITDAVRAIAEKSPAASSTRAT
jgi:undecaprenyl diphosphate synthase